MKYKKAQSEIITTVLIILLVLAAVVIVWQVVSGMLNRSSNTAKGQADCVGIVLEIVKANADTNIVKVTRRPGSDDVVISNLKFIVDGSAVTATQDPIPSTLAVFDTREWTLPDFATQKKVEIAPTLSTGVQCNVATYATSSV